MTRYRVKHLSDKWPGSRIVHNFPPGEPIDDPGRARLYGEDGFRFWVTDEKMGHRCYCGWNGETVHYGTRGYLNRQGDYCR